MKKDMKKDKKVRTLYDAFKKSAETNREKTALIVEDLQCSCSYGELDHLIGRTAEALSLYGIRPGMRVGLMINGTIEEASVWLALNKIGAVSRFIDYLKDVNYLEHCIASSKLDLLVMDEILLPAEPAFNKNELPVIVVTSQRTIRREKYISLNVLLEEAMRGETLSLREMSLAASAGRGDKTEVSSRRDSQTGSPGGGAGTAPDADSQPEVPEEMKEASSRENRPATTIINSSGTTGTPKPIALTDAAIEAAAAKVLRTDLLSKDMVVLKVIPPQVGLGLITTLFTSLINGNTVILDRGENNKALLMNTVRLVREFPQIRSRFGLGEEAKLAVFASPLFIRSIFLSEEVQDLSYIESILAAGSKMSGKELIELTKIGQRKGCQVKICNGYGQNELAGAAALNENCGNEFGSAGRPVHNTIIRVVDKETLEWKAPGETGLIIEQSDSMFSEYDGMPEATKQAFLTLPDGTTWFNTHDIGHISDTGYVYITGRTTRVAVRFDFKVPVDDIEAKVRENPAVSNAALIVTDYTGSFEKITAFVVPEDDQSRAGSEKELLTIVNAGNYLNWNEKIDEVLIVDTIPMMASGKPDYALLKEYYEQKKE